MSEEQSRSATARLLIARLAIGLAQGVVLYFIYDQRKRLEPAAFAALSLTWLLAPIVALGALGVLRRNSLVAWIAAASVICASLGAYEGFVHNAPSIFDAYPAIFTGFGLAAAAILFIGHHLITPAAVEGRWRASYERYFDEGWKDAVRLALAALFAGVFWLLLELGASLFHLIGLDFLKHLLEKSWFNWPVTTSVFALAVHITDVRASLVRGARTLLLTLLSWLLTVLTVISVGFLAALPFTGLKSLWAAGSSTGDLLAACAALVILINATYQDGERDGHPPAVLRWTARIAALALAPLVAVAAYGLALRVGQHGLTPQRIHAAVCVLVAGCYAVGYARAAIVRGPWMTRLEGTNWLTAQIVIGLLLALYSPTVDPARISVGSQVARLQSGRIAPEKFDFKFLQFDSGRWGRAALAKLAAPSADPKFQTVIPLAQAAQKLTNRWETPPPTARGIEAVLHPVGAPLPPGFATQAWADEENPARYCDRNLQEKCVTILADITDDPGPEVVVIAGLGTWVYAHRGARWVEVGSVVGEFCGDGTDAFARGAFKVVPPSSHRDLEVNGRRFTFVERQSCPPEKTKATAANAAGGGQDEVTEVSLIKPVPPPPAPKR